MVWDSLNETTWDAMSETLWDALTVGALVSGGSAQFTINATDSSTAEVVYDSSVAECGGPYNWVGLGNRPSSTGALWVHVQPLMDETPLLFFPIDIGEAFPFGKVVGQVTKILAYKDSATTVVGKFTPIIN